MVCSVDGLRGEGKAMTRLEILKAARAKIAEPEHWTQEEYARVHDDEYGIMRWAAANNPSATCWCATGAISAIQGNPGDPEWDVGLSEAFGGMSSGDVEQFNDNHTHAEVLALLDKAIAKLESEKP